MSGPRSARTAWVLSEQANECSLAGDLGSRVAMLENAVVVSRTGAKTTTGNLESIADLPLHLSNLASGYLDAGRPLDALETVDAAIDAERVAIEVGADSRTDAEWVTRSLVCQRDDILRTLFKTSRPQSAISLSAERTP